MASIYQFSEEQVLSFFAVLVRYSVLVVVLPIVGDRSIPSPIKILMGLAMSLVLFPALVRTGGVNPADALIWGATASGIISTVVSEALFGFALGFTARMAFDAVHFGGNLAGHFMGFSMATTFDPHQETQTQILAEFQVTIATLLFLAMDGHHMLLNASLDSYRIVGVGQAVLGKAFSSSLVQITGQVIAMGMKIAAPVAVALFSVHIVFAIIAKSMPQVNILILSFAITVLVGLSVIWISMPEMLSLFSELFGKLEIWFKTIILALSVK